MAIVRASKQLVSDVHISVMKLYSSRIQHLRDQRPKSSFDPNKAYTMALESSGLTKELLSKIPEGFLRMNDGMYVRIVPEASSDNSNHNQYIQFKDAQGRTENRVVSSEWTRSYRTSAVYVDKEFCEKYDQWQNSVNEMERMANDAANKVTTLLETCGTANKFVKLYPDGEALLPQWAKTKMKEVVERTSGGKKSDVVITDEAAAFLSEMSTTIVVGVLDDVV